MCILAGRRWADPWFSHQIRGHIQAAEQRRALREAGERGRKTEKEVALFQRRGIGRQSGRCPAWGGGAGVPGLVTTALSPLSLRRELACGIAGTCCSCDVKARHGTQGDAARVVWAVRSCPREWVVLCVWRVLFVNCLHLCSWLKAQDEGTLCLLKVFGYVRLGPP